MPQGDGRQPRAGETAQSGAGQGNRGGSGWSFFTSVPIIVLSFVLGIWPLGVFLIILRATGANPPKQRMVTEKPPTRVETKVLERQAAPDLAAARKKRAGGQAWWFLILSDCLAAAGLLALGNVMDTILAAGTLSGSLGDLWTSISLFIGGGALFGAGWFRRRQEKRFPLYLSVIGTKKAVSVPEIASAMGLSLKKTLNDLRTMIERGYFGPGAHLDMGLGYFFADADAAAPEKPADAAKEAEEGYSGILRNIRRANDRIADPALSRKIDQIEEITSRIFLEVERRPEKKGQIGTLLNYYLPTTQKLLDSYATFEAAGMEGENMQQAKARIEATMDRIVRGFEKQLDQLYSAEAMDVESDIRVMENMLNRDEASAEKDFGLKL